MAAVSAIVVWLQEKATHRIPNPIFYAGNMNRSAINYGHRCFQIKSSFPMQNRAFVQFGIIF